MEKTTIINNNIFTISANTEEEINTRISLLEEAFSFKEEEIVIQEEITEEQI